MLLHANFDVAATLMSRTQLYFLRSLPNLASVIRYKGHCYERQLDKIEKSTKQFIWETNLEVSITRGTVCTCISMTHPHISPFADVARWQIVSATFPTRRILDIERECRDTAAID